MPEAVIVDAIRSPIGKKKGSLAGVRSDELGRQLLEALIERNSLDPKEIDDLICGCVTQIDEQGTNIARNIVLAADVPVSIPGTSVNRLCASSLQAFVSGVQAVQSGVDDLVVVMGVESMNRVTMGSDVGSFHPRLHERFAMVSQGVSAELIADKWDLSRSAVDEFSLMSQERAMAAKRAGEFKREIVPVALSNGSTFAEDETPRDSSMSGLAKLKTAFRDNGVVTAGNSSQISDGASAILVTTMEKAKALGLNPRARFITAAAAGVDPTIMLTGPIPATKKALSRAQMSLSDIDLVEINEAFASVVLGCGQDLGIDWAKTNVRGGAIALGHPLGATGARLVTTLLHTMEDRDVKTGLVTLCIGLGQGQTAIIERI